MAVGWTGYRAERPWRQIWKMRQLQQSFPEQKREEGAGEQGLIVLVKFEVTTMAATPLHMTDHLCVTINFFCCMKTAQNFQWLGHMSVRGQNSSRSSCYCPWKLAVQHLGWINFRAGGQDSKLSSSLACSGRELKGRLSVLSSRR